MPIFFEIFQKNFLCADKDKNVVIYARACYNKAMKTLKITPIALALCFGAGALAGGHTLFARAEEATSPVTVSEENAELFLPDGYEEYLNLANPSYVAVTDTRIAVADGNTVYVCDREKEVYGSYTVGATATITQIQFSDEGRLYYSDSLLGFRELDVTDVTALAADESPIYTLTTFCIDGDTLYAMNVVDNSTELRALALDGSTDTGTCTPFAFIPSGRTPATAFDGGVLYCAINSTVYSYDTQNGYALQNLYLDRQNALAGLTSVAVYNGGIYYAEDGTPERNGLYFSDPATETSKLCLAGDGFRALTVAGGKMYCVQGKSVRELALTQQNAGFADYEISAASSSPNRLAGAGESVRANGLLVTADTGNRRVSVYDERENSYSVIPLSDNGEPFAPEHVAVDKDGKKIAVSSANRIYLYEKENGAFALSHVNGTATGVTGLAFVYDECYFITQNNGYGRFLADKPAAEVFYFSGTSVPSALTRDVYGTLYVNFGGEVYAFCEEEFRAAGAKGEKQLTLPANAHSLQSDYEGNLWYLIDDTLYRNESAEAVISGDFVYRGKNAPSSFALGFEDGAVYFGFGDYLVKMHAGTLKSLATLNEISVENAGELAFSLHEENLFLTVHERAIGIEIELDGLKNGESEYFSYRRYYRTENAHRAVVLAETQRYYLVALYAYDDDVKDNVYTANLFRKEQTDPLADEWKESKLSAAYLTNEVAASYAPCLFAAMTDERLARGAEVRVINTVEGEDGSYALVEFNGAERAVKRAYVPLSYLTEVNPLGSEQTQFSVGSIKKSKEGVELKTEDGETLLVKERTAANIYDNGDGTFTVRVERDGKVYTGVVDGAYISRGETDALRISLIVILSVLAIVIIGAYVYLMFGKKPDKRY